MNPDGLSYLDLADAFLARDFGTAISTSWGPVYPVLLAIGVGLTHPAAESLLPLTHLVTFTIFLVALATFDWFLQELLRARHREELYWLSTPALTDTGVAVFAYAVFTYSVLGLIGLGLITPDLCVETACFAVAGLVLRMSRRGPRWITAFLLGLALALGYLSKSVMFPLGLVVLITLPLALPVPRRARHTVLAATTFIGVASLLIIPISLKTGSLNFGTAGKLAYAFSVNRVPFTNWQGDSTPGTSKPLHPPRRLSANPEVFEYVANRKGTYPPWFDPGYWTAGLRTEVHARSQVLRLLRSGEYLTGIFVGSPGVAATLLVALVWLGTSGSALRGALRLFLPLTFLCLAGLAIYIPVLVEGRYVAPFVALFWILPPALARRDPTRARERWMESAPILCAVCLLLAVGVPSVTDLWKLRGDVDVHPRVAATLSALGISRGDGVVNLGISPDTETGSSFLAFWAHMAGVQIVAEMPDGRDFLCAPRSETQQLYAEFEHLGARAAVTEAMPSRLCAEGWRNVEGTDYYVRLLTTGLR